MIETTNIEVLGKKDTRSGFGEGLLEIGKRIKTLLHCVPILLVH